VPSDVHMRPRSAPNERTDLAELDAAADQSVQGWGDAIAGGLPGLSENDMRHYSVKEAVTEFGVGNVGVFHFSYWLAARHFSNGPLISSDAVGLCNKFKL